MDDAAILREIARRIRGGMDAAGAGHDAEDHNAGPATPQARNAAPHVELIAQLAHELRTPLGAMVAAAEVMAEQRLGPIASEQYRGYAANIAASGRHALAIVDRMTAEGSAGNGQNALDFVELDLNHIADRIAAVLAPLAHQRGQTIRLDLATGLPRVIADATSVRQILLNLLTNAVKHADPNSIISIVTRFTLDGPVSLAVHDSGPGMSTGVLARVLDLARTDSDPNPHGIGLPLVHRLAAANGATLRIDSGLDAPTSVSIIFAKDRVVPV